MYAIIKTGGKQYRVEKDAIIYVELVQPTQDNLITFSEVLFANDGSQSFVGAPHLSDFLVQGKILGTAKGKKETSIKYKRSHNYRRKWGHRGEYSEIMITHIGNAKDRGHKDGT